MSLADLGAEPTRSRASGADGVIAAGEHLPAQPHPLLGEQGVLLRDPGFELDDLGVDVAHWLQRTAGHVAGVLDGAVLGDRAHVHGNLGGQHELVGLREILVDWVRHQDFAQAYQFVLAAKVAVDVGAIAEDGAIQHARDVVPAVPLEPVRDIHTEIVELKARIAQQDALLAQEQERVRVLRRQVLTSRDHAIGSEAQLGILRAEVTKARTEAHEARVEAHHVHSELAKSIKDSQEAHAMLTQQHWVRHRVAVAVGPRAWAMMTAPLRPLRRALMGQKG